METKGYYRQKRGTGFSYVDTENKLVKSKEIREFIESLHIPPAWEDVWIAAESNKILATGYDSAGRKQYIYDPDWQRDQSVIKYKKLNKLGMGLPKLRKRLGNDIDSEKNDRNRVVATTVALIDRLGMRVGNKSYAETNGTYGATTLRNKHVKGKVRKVLSYIGKSHVAQELTITDPSLVRAIQDCEDEPGYTLFQYYDEDGNKCDIKSDDVNSYIANTTGLEITAKDLRTWYGSAIACEYLLESMDNQTDPEVGVAKKIVAGSLGNTPTVAWDYYVHPAIVNMITQKSLPDFSVSPTKYLSRGERALKKIIADYKFQ